MLLERMDGFRIARRAGVARTFQNIRLFAGMTVLENLIVAQHNALMRASLFSIAGLFGCRAIAAPSVRRSNEARYWLDKIGLIDRADLAGRRLALWRPTPARNRPRDVHRPRTVVPRRARGGPQSPRIAPSSTSCCCRSATRQRIGMLLDRARYERGDGHLGPHRRARLRPQDRRRHTGRGARRSRRHQSLSRRRGSGAAAAGSGRRLEAHRS